MIKKYKRIKVDTVNGIMVKAFFDRQVNKFIKDLKKEFTNHNIEISHDQKYPKDNISNVILTANITNNE